MKRVFILLSVTLLSKISLAQVSFKDCIKNSFSNPDSIAKLGRDPYEEWRKCVEEKPLMDFAVKTISGNTIKTKKLKGKVVVINFWFIDCHPCIAELPGLNKLVEEYKGKNIVFLAITWESAKRIYNDFLWKYKLDFTIIPDAKNIIDEIAGFGYPITYIINKSGVIKFAWGGGSTGDKAGQEYYENAKPVIDGLLKTQ